MKKYVIGLVAIYLSLWNLFIPIFEAADESTYYQHVYYLAHNWSMPNLNQPPKQAGVMTYPPTYYLPLTGILLLLQSPSIYSTDSIQTVKNKQGLFRHQFFNRFEHTYNEKEFSWNNQQLAVHLMRVVSTVWGLGTVWLVYEASWLFYQKNEKLAGLSAGLVGLNPMFAHLNSTIIVSSLLILLCSLVFYLLILWRNSLNATRSFIIGSVVGLAVITKATGLLLVPIVLVGKKFTQIASFVSGVLLFSGWYFGRNLILYRDLLATKEIVATTGSRAFMKDALGPINYWVGFVVSQFKTFWSGFGWSAVYLPSAVEWLLLILSILVVFGIFKGFKQVKPILLYVCFWILMLAVAHSKFPAFHAKDLYPVIVPVAILITYGLKDFFTKLNTNSAKMLIGSVFIINSIYLITRVSPKLYGL
jgi:hypothetical protein